MDYESIAYESASRANLEKIDIVGRPILRSILSSRKSTPVEILYAETGAEPPSWRSKWLTRKYLTNLGNKPRNPIYGQIKRLTVPPIQWKSRSTSGLINDMNHIKVVGINIFLEQPQLSSIHKYPHPSRPPEYETAWFPLVKKPAMTSRHLTTAIFNTHVNQIPEATIKA
ncbi:hypothetical protein GHT06_021629 [Daphnia sinensis]|uniref:Uncharacterized protein n=1 Tax=Daphnia sinensis TaxID=1820382 RepID=A0AAD5KJD9_9CRUS|nr:hypothetical protein GHT06_021629 [Daphnia sinensis]